MSTVFKKLIISFTLIKYYFTYILRLARYQFMNREFKISQSIQNFKLPRYDDLPEVELYLDQTTAYISERLEILGDVKLTSSMISNYVKHKIIRRPVKKRYAADQIAELFFIAVAKNVMQLSDLKAAIELQRRTYSTKVAYNYFVEELENILPYVFGLKTDLDEIGNEHTEYQRMLHNIIMAVSYKAYIDKYYANLRQEN